MARLFTAGSGAQARPTDSRITPMTNVDPGPGVATGPTSGGGPGGMTTWKWYAIGAVAGVAFIMWMRARKSGVTPTSGAAATTTAGASPIDTSSQSSLQAINDELSNLVTSQAGATQNLLDTQTTQNANAAHSKSFADFVSHTDQYNAWTSGVLDYQNKQITNLQNEIDTLSHHK